MNFLEMRDKELERLTSALNELINKQKINQRTLVNLNTNDFILIRNLLFVKPIDDEISKTNDVIHKLKQFDYSGCAGTEWKRSPDGEFLSMIRTDIDLKTDMEWMQIQECTKEQIETLSDAFYFNDKKIFFETLHEITDNKSLTDRYTKYFFKSSVKHSKNTKPKVKKTLK